MQQFVILSFIVNEDVRASNLLILKTEHKLTPNIKKEHFFEVFFDTSKSKLSNSLFKEAMQKNPCVMHIIKLFSESSTLLLKYSFNKAFYDSFMSFSCSEIYRNYL